MHFRVPHSNIVKLYNSGVKVSELKTKYSVSETNIYKWINQYSTKPNTEMKDVNDKAYSADDIMKMK
jgi:Mor family transcriptional regulator